MVSDKLESFEIQWGQGGVLVTRGSHKGEARILIQDWRGLEDKPWHHRSQLRAVAALRLWFILPQPPPVSASLYLVVSKTNRLPAGLRAYCSQVPATWKCQSITGSGGGRPGRDKLLRESALHLGSYLLFPSLDFPTEMVIALTFLRASERTEYKNYVIESKAFFIHGSSRKLG